MGWKICTFVGYMVIYCKFPKNEFDNNAVSHIKSTLMMYQENF